MLVKTVMMKSSVLTTVTSDTKLGEALKIMHDNNMASMPVIDGSEFKGAIEKSAIYEKYFECDNCNKEKFLADNIVSDLIKTEIPVIGAYEEIENAVALLEKMNVSFVAVINKETNKFLGILTHKIVFKQFTELFGLNQGHRVSVIAFDVPGQLSKLSNIVTENGGNIISLVVLNPESYLDNKEIIIRLNTDNITETVEAIKSAGFKIND